MAATVTKHAYRCAACARRLKYAVHRVIDLQTGLEKEQRYLRCVIGKDRRITGQTPRYCYPGEGCNRPKGA